MQFSRVNTEYFEHLLRLWPAKQLLEPRDIFEPQLERFRALIGVLRASPRRRSSGAAARRPRTDADPSRSRHQFPRVHDAERVERVLDRLERGDRPGGARRASSSRFIWPMPCSAEIEPPAAVTRSSTIRVIACPRARSSRARRGCPRGHGNGCCRRRDGRSRWRRRRGRRARPRAPRRS